MRLVHQNKLFNGVHYASITVVVCNQLSATELYEKIYIPYSVGALKLRSSIVRSYLLLNELN